MIVSDESKARKIAIEQLLREEYQTKEQRIVDEYKQDKNRDKYLNGLRSNNKTFKHIITNVNDYFDLS